MKAFLICFFLMECCKSFAQQDIDFGRIDYAVESVQPASPTDLAHLLTAGYSTTLEKTRAIFSWIAEHIDYKTKKSVQQNVRSATSRFLKPLDSVNVNSADEYVAELVIRNQSGVCEGYARLFKTLCDYAGIPCVLVTGYARGDMYQVSKNFSSNHYWNAVFVDSAWHLLDVTWASGYFTYYGSDFIKHFDDYYFFTPPALFIKDHFPDDLQWTLLSDPPSPEEFRYSPLKQRSFIKYNIISFLPTKGVIDAAVGDTVRLEMRSSDTVADKRKAMDTALLDSDMLTKFSSVVFLQPVTDGAKIRYEYVVSAENIKWLHLMYNNDVILRYQLRVRKPKQSLVPAN